MKKSISFRALAVCLLGMLLFSNSTSILAYAEGEETAKESTEQSTLTGGTSISLMPVSKVLQISPNAEYKDKMTVNNDGDDKIEIEVFAAPYSYIYSEEEKMYKLGFNNETNFTQIVRWISFKTSDGGWEKKASYSIPAHQSLEVEYKIAAPNSVPAGGQYAVIFAHTLTGVISASGIRTEASPGMVVFARSAEGDIKTAAQISEMTAQYGNPSDAEQKSFFYGAAKVKNDGNIDFNATGTLKVSPILGFGGYETSENRGRVSVIPEAELEVSDRWDDSPAFGLYHVSWTVRAGEETETIETLVFVNPILAIVLLIIVLTIISIWVTIIVRRRKERRSRLAV